MKDGAKVPPFPTEMAIGKLILPLRRSGRMRNGVPVFCVSVLALLIAEQSTAQTSPVDRYVFPLDVQFDPRIAPIAPDIDLVAGVQAVFDTATRWALQRNPNDPMDVPCPIHYETLNIREFESPPPLPGRRGFAKPGLNYFLGSINCGTGPTTGTCVNLIGGDKILTSVGQASAQAGVFLVGLNHESGHMVGMQHGPGGVMGNGNVYFPSQCTTFMESKKVTTDGITRCVRYDGVLDEGEIPDPTKLFSADQFSKCEDNPGDAPGYCSDPGTGGGTCVLVASGCYDDATETVFAEGEHCGLDNGTCRVCGNDEGTLCVPCDALVGAATGTCGDAVIDAGEACDDGNLFDADGCSADCQVTTVDPAWVTDTDADGIVRFEDNCPDTANPSQLDTDGDGVGDLCDNCENYNPDQTNSPDGDGIADACDNAPSLHNPDQTDVDDDGVWDTVDNCIYADVPRWVSLIPETQIDTDGDGEGDICDEFPNDPLNDWDDDGVPAPDDNCEFNPNPLQEDLDSDGEGDACDSDWDGDGVDNDVDNCRRIANNPNITYDTSFRTLTGDQLDDDADGYGNSCDADFDNDGDVDDEDALAMIFAVGHMVSETNCVGGACDVFDLDYNISLMTLDFDTIASDTDTDRGFAPMYFGTADYTLDSCIDHGCSLDCVGDACPADSDGDLIDDSQDNCIEVENPLQRDSDGDGCGNMCDGDFNQDGDTDFQIPGGEEVPDNDLDSFIAAFGTSSPIHDLGEPHNGLVDFHDFGIFTVQAGTPPGPSALASGSAECQ